MTIAQQLKIKDFPFEIKDAKGNLIYFEYSNGYWCKREYNDKGNLIYSENSNRYWIKREYDDNGYTIYYEDSKGKITDNRPKTTLTMLEIAAKFGISVDKLQIKK